ncbi:MAG: hypothetical protein K9H16_04805 [Bacteroidales bacterium]|nr:hypothetical protein [Bacteroidales bacterium]
MKTKAIQLTVVIMMLTATLFAQNENKSDVFTSMTLNGKNKVEIRMMIPDGEVLVLNVFNESGQKVYTARFKDKKNLLVTHNIDPFPCGAYKYEIKNGKEVVSSTQIIKSSGHDLAYKPVEDIAESGK